MLVTAWHRLDRSARGGQFVFNHIEDGHARGEKPADAFGRGWQGGTWFAWHGALVGERRELVLAPRGLREVVAVSEPRRYT